MSRLMLNFNAPGPRRGRGPLASLGGTILLGVCLGGLGVLALHLLGVRL